MSEHEEPFELLVQKQPQLLKYYLKHLIRIVTDWRFPERDASIDSIISSAFKSEVPELNTKPSKEDVTIRKAADFEQELLQNITSVDSLKAYCKQKKLPFPSGNLLKEAREFALMELSDEASPSSERNN